MKLACLVLLLQYSAETKSIRTRRNTYTTTTDCLQRLTYRNALLIFNISNLAITDVKLVHIKRHQSRPLLSFMSKLHISILKIAMQMTKQTQICQTHK